MSSAEETIETIETDVLILGSGLAGLRAAIEARRYGVDVLLVDKSLIGVNTNTRVSGAGFRAASKAGTDGAVGAADQSGTFHNYVLDHFKDTVRLGEFLNDQRLAEILCYDAPPRVQELADFGLDNLLQRLKQSPFPRGATVIRSLLDTVQKMNVSTCKRICPFELVKKDDTIVGVLGFSLETRKFVAVKAKATILATGGAGEVFERNEAAATLTGDGYAMAYQAGAQLMDMEMVHFEPCVNAEPDLPMMMDRFQSAAGRRGILRNRLGEDFIPNYLQRVGSPQAPFEFVEQFGTRLDNVRWLVSRAIALEVYEGRGDMGAVLFDLTGVPEDVWQSQLSSKYLRYVLCRGYDVTKTPIHVYPATITTLGGIRINEDCQSSLNGLYAAGEVTGGVHGAMRLGGNALTECIVFGARAGRSAAKHALVTRMVEVDNKLIDEKVMAIGEILARPASPEGNPEEIKRQIKSVMWKHVGVLRDQKGLEEAIRVMDRIQRESLPRVFAESVLKLRPALETMAMLITAQMIARAALYRRESRGGHYRLDFPTRDDGKWLNNILIRRGPEEMELSTQPVIMTRFRPQDLSSDTPLARVLDGIERLRIQRLKGSNC